MSLMEKFSDPALFDSLSMGDRLLGSLITMLMGMGITFCVLILLWAFVTIMGRFMSIGKSAKSPEQPAAAATPSGAAAPVAASPEAGDEVTAAVIAAAIAAYSGEGDRGNLIVRKIPRISGNSTNWSNAAIDDCIESRRF